MGMRKGSVVAAAASGAALLLGAVGLAPPASGSGRTTLDNIIEDPDGDNRLDRRKGEDHVVREELADAESGRRKRRHDLFFFGQMTDKHVIDEESPARVEFLDETGGPFTSAYRPQEGLSAQVVERMVRRLRGSRSPVSGRRLDLVMTTGDNSDNTQLNEVRWFIDLLDGGRTIDPDSGDPDAPCGEGGPGAPHTRRGSRYDGVRDEDRYYEPDSSKPGEDGPGYSPRESENPRPSQVRDYPRLFEAQNLPFHARGLGVPWYGIFGNHDALLQGNQPRNPGLEEVATGCVKATEPSPSLAGKLAALARGGFTPEERLQAYSAVTQDLLGRQEGDPGTRQVPADPRRRPLKKAEYIAEHLGPDRQGDGHGFDGDNVASGMGNYSLRPRKGLRFIVLDSINEGGGDGGNIDDPQFQWLHEELLKAERREQLAVVFAHHSLGTMEQTPQSPFGQGDEGGNNTPEVHYGLGPPEGGTQPCEPGPTEAGDDPTPTETVRCLFLRHRGVVAFVNGHEHNDRIDPFPREESDGFEPDSGGFWEVNTASHIDWPQQSRLIDLVDNRDGTLSIFGTIVDHSSEPKPSGGQHLDRRGFSYGGEVALLASISRELAFNDPQAENGEDGTPDKRGKRRDRNVELVVPDPYSREGSRSRDNTDRDRGAPDPSP